MADRRTSSLWGDWTPEDDRPLPVRAPAPRVDDAPPVAPRGSRRRPDDAPAPEAGPKVDWVEATAWVLAIAGLAFGVTVGIGLLLALVTRDTWLLGFVGDHAGFVVESARQAVEVPFGAIRFDNGSGEPFVYGLVLTAALVAATAAAAARRLPGPDVSPRARRALAAGAAVPYILSMSVVGIIAGEGDVSVSAGRLVFWGAVLVGGGAALGAAPFTPGAWPRSRAFLRAAFVPMLQAWAILTVALTLWALALTLTQQTPRIGYEIRESVQQVPDVDEARELGLSAGPALAILAVTPANLGLDAIAQGMLSQEEGTALLGSTDRAVDRLSPGERDHFFSCELGVEDDVCGHVRITDAPDTLPTAFGVFLTLFVITTALLAAALAGFRLAALSPGSGGTLRAFHGALVGPVWALTMLIADATVDSALDGWSTFWSVLLMGTLAGLAGAAVLHDRRSGDEDVAPAVSA